MRMKTFLNHLKHGTSLRQYQNETDFGAVMLLSNILVIFNRLRATFFNWSLKMYLLFISFLHTDMAQVVDIFPHVWHKHTYST